MTGDDVSLPFPLEFIIPEVPRSGQSANARAREAWKGRVACRAAAHVRTLREFYFLDPRPLAVTILYFPFGAMRGDVDNIVKPILDGLIGILYPDDRVIERVTVQKFEPGVIPILRRVSPTLARAIGTAPPVLYIRLDDNLDWRQLP